MDIRSAGGPQAVRKLRELLGTRASSSIVHNGRPVSADGLCRFVGADVDNRGLTFAGQELATTSHAG
jgi:hypothetical protein